MKQGTVSKLGKEYVKVIHGHPVYFTYFQSTSWEMPGWISKNWNQDCWEKYQKPQIYRWHHPYGKKRRGTEQHLDESERRERKTWLITQHSKNEDPGIWSHHVMANRWGNNRNSDRLAFLGLQNHCRWWLQPWNSKTLAPWKKSYAQPKQHIKKQRHYFANRGPSSQSYGFPSSHVLSGATLGITDKMEAWPQPPLLILQAWSRDEGVRFCDSDLFFFLSSVELAGKNVKVLIVLERSMRRHKAFCSYAQRIIHKVNHWHLFKDLYKECSRMST